MTEITRNGVKWLVHTAWAVEERGAGWSNRLYWAIVSPIDTPNHGELTKIAIQTDEQTPELKAMFNISAAVNKSVLLSAASALNSTRNMSWPNHAVSMCCRTEEGTPCKICKEYEDEKKRRESNDGAWTNVPDRNRLREVE